MKMTLPDRDERGDQTGSGLREPQWRGGCSLFFPGCGHFLRRTRRCQEQAVASLELWVSGCLFAELASQPPGAAGCNYALQLQRKFLAAGPCAGPGCTLAAELKGTMEREAGGSRGKLGFNWELCNLYMVKRQVKSSVPEGHRITTVIEHHPLSSLFSLQLSHPSTPSATFLSVECQELCEEIQIDRCLHTLSF